MIEPRKALAVGLATELAIQVAKRTAYWVDAGTAGHYASLLLGDLVFGWLFLSMVRGVAFTRKHLWVIAAFVALVLYSAVAVGVAPTALAVRNTYFWLLCTLLLVLDGPAPGVTAREEELLPALQWAGAVLAAYAVVQIGTDYAFERPWFELSGTSLNYDGVTNFGEAAKAFSFLSGPTDLACFGVGVLAIAVRARSLVLGALGATVLVLSGTRGILFAIPAWLLLRSWGPRRLILGFLTVLVCALAVVLLWGDEIVAYLYALPNSRFSLATLAPRIQMWMAIEWDKLLTGGGIAVNVSENLTDAPVVIDSGLIYLITEIGLPATLAVYALLLRAAQRDMRTGHGALALVLGVFAVASIAQIPLQTRLPNFLLCVIAYCGVYHAEIVPIRDAGRQLAPQC